MEGQFDKNVDTRPQFAPKGFDKPIEDAKTEVKPFVNKKAQDPKKPEE